MAVDSRGTRLGTGLQHAGRLDPAARERTLAAVADYMGTVRLHRAAVACIATSAMRRAADGAEFSAAVRSLTGIDPRILSGDEEATYSFLGATGNVQEAERVGVLDVGGGSSELAVDVPEQARARGAVAYTHSAEIGAVRLAERFPAFLGGAALDADGSAQLLAMAREAVAGVLAPFAEAPHPERMIVVGGTAFTAAAMIAQAPLRDGVRITSAQRARLLDALLARDLEARKALPFIRPQRADILPAGIVIIDEACRMLGAGEITVSVEDLLAGYMASADFARHALPAQP